MSALDFDAFDALLAGRLPEADALALLSRLTPEALTPSLIRDCLARIRATAVPLPPDFPRGTAVLDCCGTGGSGGSHFNTSTTVALVLAAAGVPVLKFGNRSASGHSGSFDFLEALGIPPTQPLPVLADGLAKVGVAFLFAPQVYPGLAHLAPLRKTFGRKTVFNVLGPLLHPVRPARRLLGVSDAALAPLLADVLHQEGDTVCAWVVHGPRGEDELAPDGRNLGWRVDNDGVQPAAWDWPGPPPDIRPLTTADNVALLAAMLDGTDTTSPHVHGVWLNAGAGLVVAGQARTLADGVARAQELLASGAVADTLTRARRAYGTV